MALGYTLHSIIRAKEELPINSVQEFSDADFKDMKALGAVREPTDGEVALYRLANPVSDAGAAEDEQPKAARKGRDKKVKPEASEAGDPSKADAGKDGDPDVSDPDLL